MITTTNKQSCVRAGSRRRGSVRRVAAGGQTCRHPVQRPETAGLRSEVREGRGRGRLPRGHEGLEGRLDRRLAAPPHDRFQFGNAFQAILMNFWLG
jgi:hypothetical protein